MCHESYKSFSGPKLYYHSLWLIVSVWNIALYVCVQILFMLIPSYLILMSHNNCWNVQMFSRLNWNCHCFITECRDHQSTSVLCNNHNDTDDQQLQDVSLFELESVWASHNKLWLEFPLTFTVTVVQCRIKIAVMKLMSSVHSGACWIMNQRSGVYHVSSGICRCKIPQQF